MIEIATATSNISDHRNDVMNALLTVTWLMAKVAGNPVKVPGFGSPAFWCFPNLTYLFASG